MAEFDFQDALDVLLRRHAADPGHLRRLVAARRRGVVETTLFPGEGAVIAEYFGGKDWAESFERDARQR